MRLIDWLEKNDRTQAWLAKQIGRSQQSVSSYCRECFDPAFVDPPPGVKHEIWHLTGGAVEPNDFYDLPLQRAVMRYEELYPTERTAPQSKPAAGGGPSIPARPEQTKIACAARGAAMARDGNVLALVRR